MKLDLLLDQLFADGHRVSLTDHLLIGEADTAIGTIAVLGTTDAAAVDHRIALALAQAVLDVVATAPGRPILFLVDTVGQALSRSAELLCLNGSFAHLAKCVDAARRSGHKTVSLVTANAVSGGFLSFGLMADRAYALADVSVRVMDLKAMARVTKIDHDRLTALAQSSPIFAPGAENYLQMGGIEGIWSDCDPQRLTQAFNAISNHADLRIAKGAQRGGRTTAQAVVAAVMTAPAV